MNFLPHPTDKQKERTPWDRARILFLMYCRGGDVADAQHLLRKYPEFVEVRDGSMWTPLMHAITNDSEPFAQMLLDCGADIDTRGVKGLTALHFAAHVQKREMVEFLLRRGAALDIQDSFGDTPLACARKREGKEIIALLEREPQRRLEEQKKEVAAREKELAVWHGGLNNALRVKPHKPLLQKPPHL